MRYSVGEEKSKSFSEYKEVYMKNLITKILSLTLAALMLLSFAACKK